MDLAVDHRFRVWDTLTMAVTAENHCCPPGMDEFEKLLIRHVCFILNFHCLSAIFLATDYTDHILHFSKAPVAQWIEQWIPNPCAAGSIPARGTINYELN